MNRMDILNRLVSIKNNAFGRAYAEIHENSSGEYHKVKANNLESGINQLIMEIQNSILSNCKTGNTARTNAFIEKF